MRNQLFLHRRNRNITLFITTLLVVYSVLFKQSQILLLGLFIVGCYGFLLMARDKRAAKKEAMRIPEASLFLVAALGGATGVALGMVLYRHKTRQLRFLVLIPIFLLFHCYGVWFLLQ